jgi:hypothetical protein
MNHTQVWSKAALLALLTAASLSSPVAPPPPELETLDEGEPPAVTIKKPGDGDSSGNSVTEKRDHGQTKEVKVKSGPSTYYLKPRQVGNSVPGDAQSGPPTNAQWVIKEFDLGGKKSSQDNASDNTNK